MGKHRYDRKYVVLDTKQISWTKTIIINIGTIWYPFMVLGFLDMSFKALDKQDFTDPFLKIPFIVLIAAAALFLIAMYKPDPIIIKNKN